ncbi:hypothetical protein Tco_1065030 [Tanacetum coccineum]
MVVHNQSQLGEGSAIPTDLHHTPTFIQPSTQPQKIQKPRKPKRKVTQVPQSSDPSENVTDKAVHKELGDSLVRVATTASSLEAEQDIGNINKTQSKATPNKSSSLETTLGGGPRGNTLQSDEDRVKLDELMALCTTLQQRVLDLEKTKTTQHNEIASLKRRVKKLEKRNRSRTHRLKRLYKVGLTARVESSSDKESLGEDASKQGRINAIDTDEEITLVSVQNVDEEMFDVNILDEVSAAGNVVSTAGDATNVSAATTTTDDDGEITLAQALIEMKSAKPKDKGKGILIEPENPMKKKDLIRLDEEVALKLQAEFDKEERLAREKVKKEKEANIALIETSDDIQVKIDVDHQLAERLQAQEQEELSVEEKATLFQQLLETRRKHFAAKRAEEKRNKPPTKAQKRKIIAFKRVEDDKETAELKQCLEIIPDEEEVTIDDIPLAVKSPSIVGWTIYKEGRKSYYKIMRADGKSQMYRIFSQMFKSFDSQDLEDLYKLVKAEYESTRPVEDLDLLLWGDLKTMFKPHVKDKVWRNQQYYKVLDWKLYDSYGYTVSTASTKLLLLVKVKTAFEVNVVEKLQLLRISVVCFGKKGKLAASFVGPFEIIKKVGPVAYRLDLPEELNDVHDTFHVSNLKKCLADPTLQVPLDEI